MSEIHETREPAVQSPPSTRQTITAPSTENNLLFHKAPHINNNNNHNSPSRKTAMAMNYGRPRSHSLGTAYQPLLMPQTPPPSFRTSGFGNGGGGGRSASLSPGLMHRGNTANIDFMVPNVPVLNNNYHHHHNNHHNNNNMGMGMMMTALLEPPTAASNRHYNDLQKVMEMAMQAERKRSKEMEMEEKDMTADELRAVLKRERHRMAKLSGELAKHKSLAVQSQAEAEIVEEGRINCLMRRLDDLQIEKGRIIVQLEQEEEMLTNTLQKKLDQVRREKAQLEKLIEREKLSHTDLQSTLTDLRENPKNALDEITTSLPVATAATAAPVPVPAPVVQKPVTALPPMGSLAESPDEEDNEEEEGEGEDQDVLGMGNDIDDPMES